MNTIREPRAFADARGPAARERRQQRQPQPSPLHILPSGGARSQAPTLSCVIPCRNEARNLDLLLPILCELLPSVARAWEIILVDDGSKDDTAAVMADWSALPGFRVLQLSRNFGKEAALTAGLEAAAGEVVVMMDADLQHPPALIAGMIERWRNGADIVYAVRANRKDESLLKRLGARL
ncbi:MAG TPA: glycosyltransferase family 2 protein, partial [Ramlibacter sp.]|nr:glycosyltransferase family 2 protein [Ramlibacter sp.]